METIEDAAEAALERYDEKQRESKQKKRLGEHRYAAATQLGDWSIEGGLARERMIAYAAEQAADGTEEEQELDALGVEVHARGGAYDASQYG